MAQYIKVDGAVFPYTDRDLKRDHPMGLWPNVMNDVARAFYGMLPVAAPPPPAHDPALHVPVRTRPQEVNGAWSIGWTLRDKTAAELAADREGKVELIKRERDRRLAADFEFQGRLYQRDATSVARIAGAGALALGAIVAGAQVGDFHWHGRGTPFTWIASDNTLTLMDAQTCFAFGQAAAARETEIVFAAKALREMASIPDDLASDHHWAN